KKVVAGDRAAKVTWLPMTSFNDTYAWAITKANAAKYGVKTYSDLVKKLPAGSAWCVESEFQSRPDGWAGFKTKYGISDSNITTKVLDTGAIYQATKDGQCMVGEVFATDGRIGALGLMVPQEDISYFPPYNAALTMTDATAKKYPQLVKALAPIAAKISNATMQNLNARVDVLGEDADTVAKSFLSASTANGGGQGGAIMYGGDFGGMAGACGGGGAGKADHSRDLRWTSNAGKGTQGNDGGTGGYGAGGGGGVRARGNAGSGQKGGSGGGGSKHTIYDNGEYGVGGGGAGGANGAGSGYGISGSGGNQPWVNSQTSPNRPGCGGGGGGSLSNGSGQTGTAGYRGVVIISIPQS
ncbi:MAG: hypothetical protein EBS81_10320, partial [Gammaproteobacteria bacterium]|nr:hypothetical protein [Gammaproteobacteria bacterium]